jgi:hypothetical protein
MRTHNTGLTYVLLFYGVLLSYFRKHSRLVDGLKGVDTEEVEDGFDEVHLKFIEKEFSYIFIFIDFLALFFLPHRKFCLKNSRTSDC